MLDKSIEESIEFYASSNIPMNCYEKLEKIADLVVFLASEKVGYIAGQLSISTVEWSRQPYDIKI